MKVLISTILASAILGLTIPLFANLYMYSIIIIILTSIMYGQGWNLLGGFTGQVSFGHAMFFALGAYASMIFTVNLHLDMGISLLLGGILSALYSIPIGALIFRLHGPYFGLGSLALAEILRIVVLNWKGLTNGGEGITLPNAQTFFGIAISSKQEYFYVALILATLISLFCYFIMKRKTGYVFIAIRENQDAANAMGLNVARYKSIALILSAFLTGIAGSFFGFYNKFIDPEMVAATHVSTEMIFVTVIGGIGTIIGPIVGSVVLVTLQEWLKTIPSLQTYPSLYLVIYGFLLMLVILYLPGGIVDGAKKMYKFLFHKKNVLKGE